MSFSIEQLERPLSEANSAVAVGRPRPHRADVGAAAAIRANFPAAGRGHIAPSWAHERPSQQHQQQANAEPSIPEQQPQAMELALAPGVAVATADTSAAPASTWPACASTDSHPPPPMVVKQAAALAEDRSIFCPDCDRWVRCRSQWNLHVVGKKHSPYPYLQGV